jgi:hypothetical protein
LTLVPSVKPMTPKPVGFRALDVNILNGLLTQVKKATKLS